MMPTSTWYKIPTVTSNLVVELEEVFDQCTNFDAMARPSPAKMLCTFRKSLLDCFDCLPLTISQTTILDQYDAFLAANGVPVTSVTFQAGMASPFSSFTEQTINFQLARNTQPPYPAHPKPSPGAFTFGWLPFLDNRVLQCYGFGDQVKPTTSPPYHLVLINRLHRKYIKDGVEQVSPCVSSEYTHINQYCTRNALSEFTPASCFLPNNLIPYVNQEHYDLIYAKLGINFQQIN